MSVTVKHWQDPVNLALGVWMAVSPWVLSYAAEMQRPTMNAVVVGALIAVLAIYEIVKVMAWEEWANFALGIWLAISPWALGFSSAAVVMWNAVAVGVVVAGLALWALGTDKSIGGWWSHA